MKNSHPITGEELVADNTSAAILGATSGLGQALARQLAAEGQSLLLVARDEAKLASVASDMKVRGADVSELQSDFLNMELHEAVAEAVAQCATVYIVYGSLPDQEACEGDWEATHAALNTNFVSGASLMHRIAQRYKQAKAGTIVVVSSVAGDRGRGSNYVYGAAKGALTVYADGMRNMLQKHGVHVMTVKPGFIDTPMTADIEKKPAVLWVSADRVASDIIKAAAKKKDTLYTPWFWSLIMLIIKLLPERIFKRLSL